MILCIFSSCGCSIALSRPLSGSKVLCIPAFLPVFFSTCGNFGMLPKQRSASMRWPLNTSHFVRLKLLAPQLSWIDLVRNVLNYRCLITYSHTSHSSARGSSRYIHPKYVACRNIPNVITLSWNVPQLYLFFHSSMWPQPLLCILALFLLLNSMPCNICPKWRNS